MKFQDREHRSRLKRKMQKQKEKLTGAKFGLYAAEDILAADQKSILVKEDTRLAIAETKEAENGIMDAAFDLDLPMAHYYVREEKHRMDIIGLIIQKKFSLQLKMTAKCSRRWQIRR